MQILVQPTPVSTESIDDRVSQLLIAGTNITLNYNDTANTLTVDAIIPLLDATLTALAGLTPSANTAPYFTGLDVAALMIVTPFTRTLLDDLNADAWKSTLGLGSGATITASGTATYAAYWSNATTLTSTVAIQVSSLQLGLTGYAPPVNVRLRAYTTSLESLRLDGTDTLARWPLDVPGYGFIGQLGVAYGPDVAATDGVSLRASTVRFDALGVGYRADSGYALRAASTYLDALTVVGSSTVTGTTTCSGRLHVSTGSTFYDHTGNDQIALYSQMSASGGTNRFFIYHAGTAPTYLQGTLQLAARAGFGFAPDGVHWIRAGASQFDQTGFGGVYDSRFTLRNYGNMYCDGVPYLGVGGPWVTFSDRRMKHNIQDIKCPLETMCALHGITYEYLDTNDGKPAGIRMGIIAQEVEAVIPEWIGELSGYKTSQLSQFEALTIESFKALTKRLTLIENKENN